MEKNCLSKKAVAQDYRQFVRMPIFHSQKYSDFLINMKKKEIQIE